METRRGRPGAGATTDADGTTARSSGRWAKGLWRSGALATAMAFSAISPARAAVDFSISGFLPGLDPVMSAEAVSSDGRTLVGYQGTSPVQRAFRFRDGLLEQLPDPPSLSGGTQATDVSADGGRIVGGTVGESATRALLWEGSTVTVLPPLPGDTSAVAEFVSSDGTLVAGLSDDKFVIWTNGVPALVPIPEGSGDLRGFSDDGSKLLLVRQIGIVNHPLFGPTPVLRSYLLEGGVLTQLPDPPGSSAGLSTSNAFALSRDGSVAVGVEFVSVNGGFGPYRFSDGVLTVLETSEGEVPDSGATAVSPDGSRIGGNLVFGGPFLWDAASALVPLEDLVDPAVFGGFAPDTVDGISADGRVVVGSGTDAGGRHAYRLDFGPPAPPVPFAAPLLGRGSRALLVAALFGAALWAARRHARPGPLSRG